MSDAQNKMYIISWMVVTVAMVRAEYPWTFDNDLFGGPDFWGLMNKHWRMCTVGQLQSPVNIDPSKMLFDPSLTPLKYSEVQVDSELENTGQLPLLQFNSTDMKMNISGGPLTPYSYTLHHVGFHFGRSKDNERGSEHTVDRVRFPAELQLMGYNSDLYHNFTEAMTQPKGLVGISVIVDVGEYPNAELRRLTVASQSIVYKDQRTPIQKFRPFGLLPSSNTYITYEGSLTQPGCHETVTWIVMNHPIYITQEDLAIWDDLLQNEQKQSSPVYMGPNYRPLKPVNGRLFRTNINVNYKKNRSDGSCPTNIYVDMGYRSNPKRSVNTSIKTMNKRHSPSFKVWSEVDKNFDF
ncbi:unnamed protein product [Bursaphelenchus okinawaensis]|uniref:Alpha-carbonic anhydrase domain-containing protein n=1 Tax=Bursaphelenchus okinawaensis TaxID=465554 RepID=A0A811K9G8_9BILA|nr:unnamed protein product [Bursaphelenchus okinawaensis]CAG9094862.1 unnamed protein product [Bursaphelenchus okinawaensis]